MERGDRNVKTELEIWKETDKTDPRVLVFMPEEAFKVRVYRRDYEVRVHCCVCGTTVDEIVNRPVKTVDWKMELLFPDMTPICSLCRQTFHDTGQDLETAKKNMIVVYRVKKGRNLPKSTIDRVNRNIRERRE
jgi:hypothetical protein